MKKASLAKFSAFSQLLLFLIFSVPAKVWAQGPTISGFTPTSGNPGTLVTITGSNLGNPSAFSIGGTAAIVVSKTATTLVGMVMPGSATGVISVTNASGTGSGSGTFTVTATPFPSVQHGGKLSVYNNIGAAQHGYSVAISADGNTAIVGGPVDNANHGAVWIYTRSGGNWTPRGTKLTDLGFAASFSNQGFSVSLSADGKTAMVGGPTYNNNEGAAWVYTRSGTTWTQQGSELVGTGDAGRARQGSSVSLSADGNTALVGGPTDNTNIGAVWIYTRSGGTWTQQGSKLVGTGSVGTPQQGWSVSLSADGNTAITGGRLDNSNAGAAWVFTRSGTTWTQQGAKLVGTAAVGASQQGYSVAISANGNTAMVGASQDNTQAGAAWVFTRSGTTWTQQGTKLVGTGAVGAAQQGWSVSLSADGNTASVGGYADNSAVGAAWVYTRSGTTWTQRGSKLVGTGAAGAGQQGFSVSMSADGTTAISGAVGDNSNAGAAWVYAASNTITYNGNTNTGGTVPAVTTGSYASTVTLATNSGSLVKTGYTFTGWNTLANGTGTSYAAGATYTLAGNVTLYAQWAPNLTITFDSQGGSAISNGTTYIGASIAASPGTPTRAGYTFNGWFLAASGGTAIIFPYTHGKTANFTLYAQWTLSALTVTYNSQGGSLISSGMTTLGASIAASPGTPTRVGFIFNGWFASATGGTAITFPYTHGQTADFTLYAQWIINFDRGVGRYYVKNRGNRNLNIPLCVGEVRGDIYGGGGGGSARTFWWGYSKFYPFGDQLDWLLGKTYNTGGPGGGASKAQAISWTRQPGDTRTDFLAQIGVGGAGRDKGIQHIINGQFYNVQFVYGPYEDKPKNEYYNATCYNWDPDSTKCGPNCGNEGTPTQFMGYTSVGGVSGGKRYWESYTWQPYMESIEPIPPDKLDFIDSRTGIDTGRTKWYPRSLFACNQNGGDGELSGSGNITGGGKGGRRSEGFLGGWDLEAPGQGGSPGLNPGDGGGGAVIIWQPEFTLDVRGIETNIPKRVISYGGGNGADGAVLVDLYFDNFRMTANPKITGCGTGPRTVTIFSTSMQFSGTYNVYYNTRSSTNKKAVMTFDAATDQGTFTVSSLSSDDEVLITYIQMGGTGLTDDTWGCVTEQTEFNRIRVPGSNGYPLEITGNNSSLNFDGINDFIQLKDDYYYDDRGYFGSQPGFKKSTYGNAGYKYLEVSFDFKTTQTGEFTFIKKRATYADLTPNGGLPPGDYQYWEIKMLNGNIKAFIKGAGATQLVQLSAGQNLNDGNWHSVRFTKDEYPSIDPSVQPKMKLYIDNNLAAEYAITAPFHVTNTDLVQVGLDNYSSLSFPKLFKGNMKNIFCKWTEPALAEAANVYEGQGGGEYYRDYFSLLNADYLDQATPFGINRGLDDLFFATLYNFSLSGYSSNYVLDVQDTVKACAGSTISFSNLGNAGTWIVNPLTCGSCGDLGPFQSTQDANNIRIQLPEGSGTLSVQFQTQCGFLSAPKYVKLAPLPPLRNMTNQVINTCSNNLEVSNPFGLTGTYLGTGAGYYRAYPWNPGVGAIEGLPLGPAIFDFKETTANTCERIYPGFLTVNVNPTTEGFTTVSATASAVCKKSVNQTSILKFKLKDATAYNLRWYNPTGGYGNSPCYCGTTVLSAQFNVPLNPTDSLIAISIPANTPVGTYKGIIEPINQFGCVGAGFVFTVVVNETPSITVSSSTSLSCQNINNGNTSLSYSAVTGSPVSYSITWSSPLLTAVTDAALPAGSIPILANGAVPGTTYTGTITVKNAAGCGSAAKTFTLKVNGTPTVDAGPDILVCGGTNLQATFSNLGGSFGGCVTSAIWQITSGVNSQIWTNNEGTTPESASVTFNGGYNTVSLILISDYTGCGYATDEKVISVDYPRIFGLSTPEVCQSSATQTVRFPYLSLVGGASSYSIQWANTLPAVASTPLPPGALSLEIPANTPAGNYSGTLTITNALGCPNTQPISLRINALPLAGSIQISGSACGSAALSLTGSSSASQQLLWQKGGQAAGSVSSVLSSTPSLVTNLTDYYYAGITGGLATDEAGNIYYYDFQEGLTPPYTNIYSIMKKPAGGGAAVRVVNLCFSSINCVTPVNIAVDKKTGSIWVSDPSNIYIYTPGEPGALYTYTGRLRRGTENGTDVDVNMLYGGMFVDAGQNVYYATTDDFSILEWGRGTGVLMWPKGAPAARWVAGGIQGSSAKQFNNPQGILVSGEYLYVADNGNNRIQKWKLGDTSGVTIANQTGPRALAMDLNGNLYVGGGNSIYKYAPGSSAGVLVSSALNDVGHMAFDPSGNLLVTETAGTPNKITKFSSSLLKTFQAASGGSYTVRVTDANGCSNTTAAVVVNSIPAAVAGLDVVTCAGSAVQLGAEAVPGNSYSWSPAAGLSSASVSSPMANPSVSTTYTLTETGPGGCTKSSQVMVSIKRPSESHDSLRVCNGIFWHGKYYQADGVYSFDTLNAVGCDSIVYLHLGVDYSGLDGLDGDFVDSLQITGPLYVCRGDTAIRYVLPFFEPTTYSNWSWTLPAGMTGNSSDSTIKVSVGLNFQPGTIVARASNACGVREAKLDVSFGTEKWGIEDVVSCGPYQWKGKTYNQTGFYMSDERLPTACGIDSIPYLNLTFKGFPVIFTQFSGPTGVCRNKTNIQYSIPSSGPGCNYTWVLPAGLTGSSTSNSIMVSSSSTFAGGTIKVKVNNDCGSTPFAELSVVAATALPAAPAAITGENTICPGGFEAFECSAVAGATYLWTIPANATFIDGQGTSSVTILFDESYTTGAVSVKTTNCFGTSTAARSLTVVKKAIPATPGVITGTNGFCVPSTQTFSIAAVANAFEYSWTVPANASIVGQDGNTLTVSFNENFTSGNLSVAAGNCMGTSAARILSISRKAIPLTPGVITGPNGFCVPSTQTYSIAAVANASDYTWTAPANASIVSQTGTSVTVEFGAAYTTGNLSVAASNCSGTSAVRILAISRKAIPGTPGVISGANGFCRPTSALTHTYSIVAVTNATDYTWTAPANASIVSQTGTSVTVEFGAAYTTGTLSVRASNCSGTSAARVLTVASKALPGTVGVITGITTGACSSERRTYSIVALANTDSYEWTAPANASIHSGQGSTSVVVEFAAGFTTGSLSVKGVNCSGISATARTLALSNVTATPAVLTGPNTAVCAGSTQTYSTSAVANATTYIWSVPAGAIINSGQGSTSISVTFPTPFTSGAVTVKSGTACYTSAAKSLTVYSVPVTPASITGATLGVCGGSTQTYTCPVSTTGATSYNWTVPTGATINSGQGSNSISVTLPAGFATGNVSVQSVNSCGSSILRSLAIRSTLAAPGLITGQSTNLCGGGRYTYSIAAVAGASSYNWTLPSFFTMAENLGTSITVDVPASGFTSGTLSVSAQNACGAGLARSLALSATPAVPASISGPAAVCPSATGLVYSTPAVAGVTTYTWTVPSGASITSGQGTGSIIAKWGTAAGSITVKAGNACGTTATAKVMAISLSTICRQAVEEETAVMNAGSETMMVFPNPASQTATLSFGSAKESDYQIRVINALGQSVYSSEGKASEGANTINLNLENLKPGLHIVQLVKEGSRQQVNLIVK